MKFRKNNFFKKNLIFCKKTKIFLLWYFPLEFWGSKKIQNGQRRLKSSYKFPDDRFDRLNVFFRHRMQKIEPFYREIIVFAEKSRNLNLLFFPNSRFHNIQESKRIWFFEICIIFVCFSEHWKRRSTGGGRPKCEEKKNISPGPCPKPGL